MTGHRERKVRRRYSWYREVDRERKERWREERVGRRVAMAGRERKGSRGVFLNT